MSELHDVTERRYRRSLDSDVWHFYRECPEYPRGAMGAEPVEVVEKYLRDGRVPEHGLLCDNCVTIEAKRADMPKRGRPRKVRE